MIHSFVFSEGKMVGQNIDIDALRLLRADKGLVLWVDLDNPTPEEAKLILEDMFSFHPLAVEDCMTPSHFPKLEDYEDEYLFMVMHAVDFSRTDKFSTTELDLFLGRDFLVTYHATSLQSMQQLRDRYSKNLGPIARGPDRLAHLVLNAIVERYKPVTQELLAEVEELEDIILSSADKKLIEDIINMRREINDLRQIVRPQMEVIYRLTRGESKLIRANLVPYYRDLHDTLARIEQTAESFNERLILDFDVYINRTANQANEGIKVLTALTAITLPPMLIGSWYGMNFKNMPELDHPSAYWIVMAVMFGSMIGFSIWIKMKKWF